MASSRQKDELCVISKGSIAPKLYLDVPAA